jgi:hypothetical protein
MPTGGVECSLIISMFAYLMAVSASGTQRQDWRFLSRGACDRQSRVYAADTCPPKTLPACGSSVETHAQHNNNGSRPASWKCILSPGFQDRSRRDPKYVPRAVVNSVSLR